MISTDTDSSATATFATARRPPHRRRRRAHRAGREVRRPGIRQTRPTRPRIRPDACGRPTGDPARAPGPSQPRTHRTPGSRCRGRPISHTRISPAASRRAVPPARLGGVESNGVRSRRGQPMVPVRRQHQKGMSTATTGIRGHPACLSCAPVPPTLPHLAGCAGTEEDNPRPPPRFHRGGSQARIRLSPP